MVLTDLSPHLVELVEHELATLALPLLIAVLDALLKRHFARIFQSTRPTVQLLFPS